MYQILNKRIGQLLARAGAAIFTNTLVGIEKETLRVGGEGKIAQTTHPIALGSPLTHPYITTDYSEALAEFITPPFSDLRQSLDFLADTQRFVYSQLKDEILWATSMPCVVAGEDSIPIAQYGRSNPGRMKTIYRVGLGYRYGKVMQVIAGVHFNFSMGEAFWQAYADTEGSKEEPQTFVSSHYFDMLRNLQRIGWLIPYLFGASPAVCKSFLGGRPTNLSEFNSNTYYGPYATSLRMGDIGYQNNKENEIGIKANYDSLSEYIKSLTCAITTSYPGYERIGVKVEGEYRQLNTNILQIENEYYSTVRPKQILDGYEKPTIALRKRGVRYIELRSLDVNAFDPLGINESQCRFIEALCLFCLLHESPPISEVERKEIDINELATAHRGRDPQLKLWRNGRELYLSEWGKEICEAMQGICEQLDEAEGGHAYREALASQIHALANPGSTPSARVLVEMREHNEGFFAFALRKSLEHKNYFISHPLSPEKLKHYHVLADKSLQQQRAIEAGEKQSLDEFLQAYFAQQ